MSELKSLWVIDAAHTEINFKVKHLMISNVSGSFASFSGEVSAEDDNLSNPKISLTIDASSIDTGVEQRDAHLKSADFLEAEKYPSIIFASKSLSKVSGSDYKLVGDLSIKDVTKEVVLDVEFNGISKDPWGATKAGYSVSGKINRKEFGLTWNVALETGGVLVGEEIKLSAEVELTKS